MKPSERKKTETMLETQRRKQRKPAVQSWLVGLREWSWFEVTGAIVGRARRQRLRELNLTGGLWAL